jgi:hypothetical protein
VRHSSVALVGRFSIIKTSDSEWLTIDRKGSVSWLTEMYGRSDRFPACLRLLLDRGALEDPVLALVLLNKSAALSQAIDINPSLL